MLKKIRGFVCLFSLLLLSFFGATQLIAKEVDHYTFRNEDLADASEYIDQEVNRRLRLVVERANEKLLKVKPHFGCKSDVIRKSEDYRAKNNDWNKIARYFGGPTLYKEPVIYKMADRLLSGRLLQGYPVSLLEGFVAENEEIEKVEVSLQDSIYANFTWTQSLFKAYNLYTDKVLADIIKIAISEDEYVLVGSDKLGHFFSEGKDYYNWMHHKGYHPLVALVKGQRMEETYVGRMTTGILSWADLASNLDGYHFWRNLAHGPNPYIVCENNKYVLKRKFKIKDHVTKAWDESYNCNDYRNKKMKKEVDRQVKKRGFRPCPASKEVCLDLIRKLDCAEYIITPKCFKFISKEEKKKLGCFKDHPFINRSVKEGKKKKK